MNATSLTRPAAASAPALLRLPGVLAPVAFAALLCALSWGTWGDLGIDTGYDLVAADRIAGGDYPYADFTYYYGPLGVLLLAPLYAVFGAGIGPAVAFGLVLSVAIVALTYAVTRMIAGRLGATLAAALAATAAFGSANNSFVLPHTFSAPLAMLLCLGALYAAAVVARDGGARWLAGAGACAGLVALTRPEFTLAVLAALGLWLVLRARDGGDRRTAAREFALVGGPAFAIPAVVYGVALTQVSPRELVTENLYPVDFIREAGSVVLESNAPMTLASVAELAGRLGLYAAGAAALVGIGVALARGGRARTAATALVVGAVVALAAVLAVRPETARHYLEFAYAWIPAGAWLAVGLLLWRFSRREGGWEPRAQLELMLMVLLAVLATKNYAGFFPHPKPEFPPEAPYVMPLVGAFLAWLHLREIPRGRASLRALGAGWLVVLLAASTALVVGDAQKESYSVGGPNGTLTALPEDGPAYAAALEVIERETRAGEPILLAPQMTALYVMADRDNPLGELSLLPGALASAADEDRAIETLEREGVRLAIVDRADFPNYDHGSFGETFNTRLATWLRSEFRRTAVLRGEPGDGRRVLDVWQRRPVD